ncbi:MAG: DNA-directed RNA polymerase subunit omega [Fimbriimonadales bacterium]
MALYPERDKLEAIEGKYVLVNLAARRAAQISHDHAPALVDQPGEHPLTTALLEIADGAVIPVYEQPTAADAAGGFDVVEFGSSSADSLDAAFADFFGEDQMVEEDVEGDLGAFGLGGGAAEPDVIQGSDDTISLSDLADEEEAMEGEESPNGFGAFGLGGDEEESEDSA